MAIGSFSSALSGLNANGTYLSVIGNNLANINTVGFKASAVTFQDLVSQTVGGTSLNPRQVGLGVITGSIAPVFDQGAIENSRESTNAAIQGNGFFVVAGPNGNAYTRAGNFSFDSEGTLATPDGWRVQGYSTIDPATGDIITTGEPGDIVVPAGVLRAPVATTLFRTQTNLNAGALVGDVSTTTMQVYDSLGSSHIATINYTKTGIGAWTYQITVPGTEVTPAPAGGAPAVLASGSLTFDATGQIATVTPTAPSTGGGSATPGPVADVQFTTPAWANGAQASPLVWDLVDDTRRVSLTGFSSPSDTTSKSQNGTGIRTIGNMTISSDGSLIATFGDGQTITVGQLALANFNNPKGLLKLGSNRYGEGQAAGIANIGAPGTGGRGTLIGSALEQSNVDIAQEFTQMILAQRGYQANSKTITVSDELLLETLNLKR